MRIFKEVQQKTPNIKLLLLGEGELFSKIQNLAEDLEIKDKIIFAGVHKDVENYYQATTISRTDGRTQRCRIRLS